MKNLTVKTDPEASKKFDAYPEAVKPKMDALRSLILETAEESEGIKEIEESLKWGEPSYRTKKGSTIRIDWKEKSPDDYAVYFQCTSRLVPVFKEFYEHIFTFEKTRAIRFALNEEIPKKELKACIRMALHYHSLKHLPLLGHQEHTIRTYKPEDKDAVINLLRMNTPAYFHVSEEKGLQNYLEQELEDYFVVTEGSEIIGAGGINYFNKGKSACLSWDIIAPGSQGKGIGRKLADLRIKQLQNKPEISRVIVRTSQLTHIFYEKMGFKLLRTEENFWAEGIHLYEMELA